MIWQETDQVAVIVMLTQLYEGARDKCFQYYPEDHGSEEVELQLHDQNGEVMVGTVKVEESVYDESCKATIRKIRFSCNGQTKTVYHLFFLAWPDFSVPELEEDRNALLKLIDLSREKNGGWDNPRIVHCSAGVGRSGTFIALEHLLAELEIGHLDNINDSEDCIYDTVSKLREQRMTMVQSEQQYHFLYTMLADAYRKRLSDGDQIDKKPVKGPATEMLPPGGGEPSPKAIRLSRSLTLKNVFSDIRERSRSQRSLSRRREAEKTEGKTP